MQDYATLMKARAALFISSKYWAYVHRIVWFPLVATETK